MKTNITEVLTGIAFIAFMVVFLWFGSHLACRQKYGNVAACYAPFASVED